MTIIITERITLGWHKPKLRSHLMNVTAKVNKNSRGQFTLSHGYVATSGKLREKNESTLESWQESGWTNVWRQSVPDSCSGNRESVVPTVDRFDVGTADVSDDHDWSRCLVGRSLLWLARRDLVKQRCFSKRLSPAWPGADWLFKSALAKYADRPPSAVV